MVTDKNRRSKGKKVRKFSRRDFIKTAGTGLAVAGLGANIMIPGRACAGKRQLRIVQWTHPVPRFDDWFKNTYAKEWGEKNNTEVIVENHP